MKATIISKKSGHPFKIGEIVRLDYPINNSDGTKTFHCTSGKNSGYCIVEDLLIQYKELTSEEILALSTSETGFHPEIALSLILNDEINKSIKL